MTIDQFRKYLIINYAAGNEGSGGAAPAEGASTTGADNDQNTANTEQLPGNTGENDQGSNNNQDTDVSNTDDADEGDGEGAGRSDQSGGDTSKQQTAATKPVHVPDWRDKQIARQHRKLSEVAQERDNYREMANRLQTAPDEGEGDESNRNTGNERSNTQSTDQTVEQAAAQLIAQRDLKKNMNAMYNAGIEKIGETFQQSIDNLKAVGGVDPDTMSAILATDDPAKIMHELGQDPDKLFELQELPFAERVAKLVKMAIPPPPVKKKLVSGAPEPTDEVNARAAGDQNSLDDKIPADEWHRRRTAQREQRWKEKQAGGRV